ncbi:zinc finger FYVE domain-containing protein 26 homolog isoform X2 [Teleopsis dalmanni]|uniref:zinc finger FYVE domain-containing protein 26 homolog isoform X2 n=1 Tax=Teleopsis dalmanni TaxID=139649 RepID=UPI0018CF85DF|nr:zinc finger FYVE domain-containing protein 26 homolog isoform X2 [Teleopsis dalmanni]
MQEEKSLQNYFTALSYTEKEFVHSLMQSIKRGESIEKHIDKTVNLIVKYPYPTLHIIEILHTRSKLFFTISVTNALKILLNKDINSTEFISFLVNFPFDILNVDFLHSKLISKLAVQPVNDKVYLSLICRREPNLLLSFLDYFKKNVWEICSFGLPTKELILQQALYDKHFIPLLYTNAVDLSCISDIATKNNLLIIKIANEFADSSRPLTEIGNISKWMEVFNSAETTQDILEVHTFFYMDFRRICTILAFLVKYQDQIGNMKVEALHNNSTMLELIFKHKINAGFEATYALIETVYKWQPEIYSTKNFKDSELEALTYYSALFAVFDIITDTTHAGDYSSQIQDLSNIMRLMHNINTLCALIENIFQLMFLRWDHLRAADYNAMDAQRNYSKPQGSSSLDSSDSISAKYSTQQLAISSVSGNRNGFICSGRALQTIFTYLKNFVTKKLHSIAYKNSSECIQIRFQRIVDIIGDTLWKYSVLKKIDDSLLRSGAHKKCLMDSEELIELVKTHVDCKEKSSSDDESRERLNYRSLTRRKAAKKRRRATVSGALITNIGNNIQSIETNRVQANIMVASVGANSNITNVITELKSQDLAAYFIDRSIIPKMLVSAETVAVMALSLNNFDDAKYIVKTFNLENSELNHELSFVEQHQLVKQKLTTIFANYKQQNDNSNNKATVDQIRNVAAIGFEISKIINVVEHFSFIHKLKQTPKLTQLLSKYSSNPQYAFLEQFEERNLNALVITDLILNLPFNREITSSILMLIRRQQQMTESKTSSCKDDAPVRSKWIKNIGAAQLLQNLCDCIRLTQNDYTSLKDILSNNYYSLKPRKFETELQRESTFNILFNKPSSDLGSFDNLEFCNFDFQKLQKSINYYVRFIAYVMQLRKLLQLRDSNLEYHLNELLKTDPYEVIGDLIFECNMTPMEIEANVVALNMNMIHVIALNICPEIVDKRINNRRLVALKKQTTILNYVSNQNKLLAYLLQGVIINGDFSLDEHQKINSKFLIRFLKLQEVEKLNNFYEGNKFVAAFKTDFFSEKISVDSCDNIEKVKLLMIEIGNLKSKEKRSEGMDDLISELIAHNPKHINLGLHMRDIWLRAELIKDHFTHIETTRLAKELIESTLHHRSVTHIPLTLRNQLKDTLADIKIYAKVSEVLQFELWPEAYNFGLKTPNAIFEKLLKLHLYKLCYKWSKVVNISNRFKQQKSVFLSVLSSILLELKDDEQSENIEVNKYLLQILELFPNETCIEFLNNNKDKMRSLFLVKYAIEFLVKNNKNEIQKLKNYTISIIIFEQLKPRERDSFWHLLRFPLLIIEQLIMNAKFETLTKILGFVRPTLQEYNTKVYKHSDVCIYCFDKRGHVYDIHTKNTNSPRNVHFQIGSNNANSVNSAFMLLNFNLYQYDHYITNECIDLLLRIYATKALDYYISERNSASEGNSQSTDFHQSLDSLCGAFQLPKHAPTRSEWVKDEDTTHCMCCKRAAFTMLMRRHHCRRCGRVVCFACSTHRLRIPELYDEVEVRICDDCQRIITETQSKTSRDSDLITTDTISRFDLLQKRHADLFKWKLSGNITHDKLLREEFCYDHAPSVALCLSILSHHLGQQKCVDLLLYHCRKMEKLIVPNPEIDYELVAKMMNCLALAAKVRGGPDEVETIREHSNIIMSIVQNGCESLISTGPFNNNSLCRLADSLVQVENWELALELHLKYGFSTAGVMAAHGLACLKTGCFDVAREKFSYCMPKLANQSAISKIYKYIKNRKLSNDTENTHLSDTIDVNKELNIPVIKRPQRGPALLLEVLNLIESLPPIKPQPETLHRASIIRDSSISLSSLFSRHKEHYVKRIQEPALNILTTLGNLKMISKAVYGEDVSKNSTKYFDESMHYVLTYGSHTDILQFLMRHEKVNEALRYFLIQNLDADLFIQNIYLLSLRCGRVPQLITNMQELDGRVNIWRNALLQTCRYLESQNLLNSLYQLQILLNDPVRASVTCVKFYTSNCHKFQQLHENVQHLQNAHAHLQAELENCQWNAINLNNSERRKNSTDSQRSNASLLGTNIQMQMDGRSLNSHINTILKQMEVAKFLANCEKEYDSMGAEPLTIKILKQIRIDSMLPTLFDNSQKKIQICILILLCGKNIEEGFGLVYRIIQDYKLPMTKVFAATAKYLARNQRISEVEKLLSCAGSNNGGQ